MEQTNSQKAQSRYYSKNKDVISTSYKSYYEKNKEEILRKRRERYARNQPQRTANELAQLFVE